MGLQEQCRGFSFCPMQRRRFSLPHPARVCSLSGGKPAYLPSLAGPQDRAVCLPTPPHHTRHQSLRLLNTSQPGSFLSQPVQLLTKIIKLGTPVPTPPLTYLNPSCDFQIPDLPTAEGLGSSLLLRRSVRVQMSAQKGCGPLYVFSVSACLPC